MSADAMLLTSGSAPRFFSLHGPRYGDITEGSICRTCHPKHVPVEQPAVSFVSAWLKGQCWLENLWGQPASAPGSSDRPAGSLLSRWFW